jgi:hypothetical protein
VNHGELNPGLAGLRKRLVILAQAAVLHQPGKGALDDPASGQNREAFLPLRPLDDLNDPGAELLRPLDEAALVALIGPEEL